jgi:predicted phage gp36 major capsid-like protein
MKKLVLLLMVGSLSFAAQSQSATPTKKEAEKDMRKDVKEIKEERKIRNKKIAKLQFKKAAKDQKEINEDRKDMKANKKHLKNKGVKNPVENAKKQVG